MLKIIKNALKLLKPMLKIFLAQHMLMRDLITDKKLLNNRSYSNDKNKNFYADILHGNADF